MKKYDRCTDKKAPRTQRGVRQQQCKQRAPYCAAQYLYSAPRYGAPPVWGGASCNDKKGTVK